MRLFEIRRNHRGLLGLQPWRPSPGTLQQGTSVVVKQLELHEHRSFQERVWTVQRWAWIGYGLVIIAALLGFAGEGGLFSRSQIRAGNNQIDVPRIARWQTGETISITIAASGQAERSILLSPQFGRQLAIEGVQPQPLRSTATAAGEELVVLVRPGEAGVVRIRIKADAPGIVRGTIAIDGASAAVTLIILP